MSTVIIYMSQIYILYYRNAILTVKMEGLK